MLEHYFFIFIFFLILTQSFLYYSRTVYCIPQRQIIVVFSPNTELHRVPVEVVNESLECAVIDGRKLSDQELVPL